IAPPTPSTTPRTLTPRRSATADAIRFVRASWSTKSGFSRSPSRTKSRSIAPSLSFKKLTTAVRGTPMNVSHTPRVGANSRSEMRTRPGERKRRWRISESRSRSRAPRWTRVSPARTRYGWSAIRSTDRSTVRTDASRVVTSAAGEVRARVAVDALPHGGDLEAVLPREHGRRHLLDDRVDLLEPDPPRRLVHGRVEEVHHAARDRDARDADRPGERQPRARHEARNRPDPPVARPDSREVGLDDGDRADAGPARQERLHARRDDHAVGAERVARRPAATRADPESLDLDRGPADVEGRDLGAGAEGLDDLAPEALAGDPERDHAAGDEHDRRDEREDHPLPGSAA